MNGTQLHDCAVKLLAQAGVQGEVGVHRLAGGRNNRVYRLDVEGRLFLLKQFFSHEFDSRDRFASESAFVTFARESGVHAMPRPLGSDAQHHLALYEFIDGKRVQSGSVSAAHIEQALAFLESLNAQRTSSRAAALPLAAEACFSVEDHIACVERRVTRLAQFPAQSELEHAAAAFISERLLPAWLSVRAQLLPNVAHLASLTDRLVSPSDFGFHNALLTADGTLFFHDFEYAGWDGAEKLVCDFFHQPQVPVPLRFLRDVSTRVAGLTAQPELHLQAMQFLMPAYRVKWCCIALNDFLPAAAMRRDFAQSEDLSGRDAPEREYSRKAAQLGMAQRILENE